MKHYITERTLKSVAYYMNDDIREKVHFELAECTPEEFLKRYIELDKSILSVLESEFNIDGTKIKPLSDLNCAELYELDQELLSPNDMESMDENPEVVRDDDLGLSGYYRGYHWFDVELSDGTLIDVYAKY